MPVRHAHAAISPCCGSRPATGHRFAGNSAEDLGNRLFAAAERFFILRSRGSEARGSEGRGWLGQLPGPVPRQNSFTIAELVLRALQAALRYSLIKPWTTCLRLIDDGHEKLPVACPMER
jgi:hypothetical protein